MPDRNDEEREGWVALGRRGWRKVSSAGDGEGGGKPATEVQPVTPGWAGVLRENAAKRKSEEEEMTDTDNYRTALRDAEGQPIPLEGEIRVLLDDDIVDRLAPEGWIHARTVREVCLLILQERVVEISLDNDLNGDIDCGLGYQVVDFLEELHGAEHRPLWPRDGITIHTANPSGRATMKRAIETLPDRLPVEVEDITDGSQPHYLVRLVEQPGE